MANPQNVTVVVEHMLEALRTMSSIPSDDLSKKLLVNRIIEISKKYPY